MHNPGQVAHLAMPQFSPSSGCRENLTGHILCASSESLSFPGFWGLGHLQRPLGAMAVAASAPPGWLSSSEWLPSPPQSGGSYSSSRAWPDRPPRPDRSEDPSRHMWCVASSEAAAGGWWHSPEGQGIRVHRQTFFPFLPSLESPEPQLSEQASCATKHLSCFPSPSLSLPWGARKTCLRLCFPENPREIISKRTDTGKALRTSLSNTVATTRM